jgi:hypothetical protein
MEAQSRKKTKRQVIRGRKEIHISQRRNEDGFKEAARYSVVAVRADMYEETQWTRRGGV